MKKTLKSLFLSGISLLLCVSMLAGSTFAWFTDEVKSGNNVILAGNLDIEMYWSKDLTSGNWINAEDANAEPVFNYDKWEPGYSEVRYVKIKNAGSLAFKYALSIIPDGEVSILADVLDVYYVENTTANIADRAALKAMTPKGTLRDAINGNIPVSGVIIPDGKTANNGEYVGETIIAIAIKMRENAGNEYKKLSTGTFSLKLTATQYDYEKDSFDDKYDEGAKLPEMENFDVVIDVPVDASGVVTADTTIEDNGRRFTVPAGVKTDGTGKLGVKVTEKATTDTNVILEANEVLRPIDVHVDGIADGNTVPVIVNLGVVLPTGLNIGNYTLYHVENGQDVAMTSTTLADLDAHNEFYYDPATGEVIVAMASYSEVALVAKPAKWEGGVDHTWYDANAIELTIANADQLWSFSQIVGGMAKDEDGTPLITYTDSDGDEHHNDTFAGKTVTLLADVNLGDEEANNNPDLIFYPIGYWNSDESYEKTGHAVSSGFYTFQGTFDGNGNTISNFYQNTWEMKGDHDWYDANLQYYRDGMGLFGRVLGGTIKNLTVDNFSCDSEIGTTGVIAAYADSKDGQPAVFENISITNCNPRVYNIGNGGIVGCAGWYSRNDSLGNEDYTNAVVFRNITVDQTNKISALWGSWGVSCAGILGQYYPNSACGIKMENCHVAAIIDVNNDVCSNYQYYWYRYAGMFIGTIRANTTDANGYEVADTTGVFAKDCTYTMGDWNEYWYCEIVANSLASYTHDHQFSRLDNITDISEIKNTDGTWKKEGHFALLSADRKSVECYHIFKNSETGELYQHFHEDSGYETVDVDGDGVKETVLKEDRQRYFIPFNQLLTGLDMGIKAHTEFEGITFVENGTVKSEEKFEKLETLPTFRPGQTVKLGDLVKAIVDETKIAKATLYVAVSPATESDKVSATCRTDNGDWRNSTITFAEDCEGSAKIVITDYFYCTPTVIYLNPEQAAEKFTAKDVAEQKAYTTITLGELFSGANIDDDVTASVLVGGEEIATINGTKDDWAEKAISLTKDGKYTVIIKEKDDYCMATQVEFTVITIDKFEANDNLDYYHVLEGDTINKTLGDIFASLNDSVIDSANVTVTISKNGAECVYAKNASDWKASTLGFTGIGEVTITITDNNACNTATAIVLIGNPEEQDVFASNFNNTNFTYRVGNVNAVKLNSLFSATNLPSGANVIKIEVAKKSGNASAKYTQDANWANGEIQFSGTGVVTVTIDSNAFTKAVELTLEVIDAVNATGATSATSNNVVLLNNAEFSTFEVSGGYTLYGNGFTLTCGSDNYGLNLGTYFVKLDNGTLDNVQIVCPNFDYATLYDSNMKSDDNRKEETSGGTRYYNVRSGVMVSGNSQILNSRISGGRAAINVTNGNCLIDNTRIELGAVASLLVGAANSLVLRDITLVQEPVASTFNPNKTIMGFSVLYMCDAEGNATNTKIEGTLIQQAWVDESDSIYVPSAGSAIISEVLDKNEYVHNINGVDSINLGFAYMPQDQGGAVKEPNNINDIRDNGSNIPYENVMVGNKLIGYYYVFSYKNTNGTADSFKTETEYVPNRYSDIITVSYSETTEGLTAGKTFDTDSWVYELNVDLDKLSGYAVDFSKLSMSINGTVVTDFKVNGSSKPISPVAVTAGGTTYVLTAIVNGKEYTASYKVIGTETSKDSPSLVGNPTYGEAFVVSNSYDGDWSAAAPVLDGITIRYWSVADAQYKEIDLSKIIVNNGKLNGTNSYWEYKHSNNDFTLKLTNTNKIHDSKGVYGMPVGADGKLYFTISDTKGFVSTGSGARNITIKYEFTDNNGGETLEFTHTWTVNHDGTDQYSYSDLVKGTLTKLEQSSGGGGFPCVTPDTLVTLADGTQKRIDQVTYNDQLLVWNFYTGKYDFAPASILMNHGASTVNVTTLNFADGTSINTINGHGFFDVATNEFVLIDEFNAADYIGHSFVKQSGDGYVTTELVSYSVEEQYTEVWSILTAEHYNCMLEGMWTVTAAEVENSPEWLMPYEIGEDMKYDEASMQADIDEYGLYTYEDFAEYMTYEQFVALGLENFKVSVGKGYITWDEILYLIGIHIN